MKAKTYLEHKSKRVSAQFDEILDKAGFKEAVVKFRRQWDIPKDGYKSQPEVSAWYRRRNQKMARYLKEDWPKAKKRILSLEKQGKLAEAEEIRNKYNRNNPLNKFRSHIRDILDRFDLDRRWFDAVKAYALANSPVFSLVPLIGHSVDIEGRIKDLHINIDKDTRLSDIKALWPDVEYLQAELPGKEKKKFIARQNRQRDKAFYDLHHKGGLTYKEIGDTYGYAYDDVGTAIRNYKRQTGTS